MATYTITAAEKKKEIEGKNGPLIVYTLSLGDKDRSVDAEVLQKPSSPPPEVGSQVEGTLQDTEYGWKFRRAKPAYSGGGGRDPKETASIVRQHSQHMALLHIEGMERRFVPTAEEPHFKIDSLETIKQIIQWFQDDAMNAGEPK